MQEQVRDREAKLADGESRAKEKDARIDGLEQDLRAARQRTEEVEAERNERDSRIRDLESSLAKIITDRDALAEAKRDLSEKRSELEVQLGASVEKVGQLEALVLAEQERAKKLQVKWDHDKASLDRAKNALAAVLLQIEEVEARGLEG